ncbi:MAG: hypothetical protein WA323_04210 [Candidatus Nitrosopolaris sp.]
MYPLSQSQIDQCNDGYDVGNANALSHHISAIIRQTSAYHVGLNAGLEYVQTNSTITYNDPCGNSYTGTSRNYAICELGYTDGQNQTPFNKAETYAWGYHWGKLGAEGKASGDRAGDCELDPYIPLRHDICEQGWNLGWSAIQHKHIDEG